VVLITYPIQSLLLQLFIKFFSSYQQIPQELLSETSQKIIYFSVLLSSFPEIYRKEKISPSGYCTVQECHIVRCIHTACNNVKISYLLDYAQNISHLTGIVRTAEYK